MLKTKVGLLNQAMEEANTLYGRFGVDRDLVSAFFVFFSRFEFALKESDYIKRGQKRADPAWDDFSRKEEHKDKFDTRKNEESELGEASNYLIENPPKKQVQICGNLEWGPNEAQNTGELEKILIYVRGVRNNLFHGGKFPYDQRGRNGKLIKSCLIVLCACVELDAKVEKCFVG